MRRMFAYTRLTAFMIDHFIKCANISFISVSVQAVTVLGLGKRRESIKSLTSDHSYDTS